MSEAPERHYVVTIIIGADGEEEVKRALSFLSTDAFLYGVRDHTLGGPDYGVTMTIKINEGVTHKSYFDAVEQWLAEEERGA